MPTPPLSEEKIARVLTLADRSLTNRQIKSEMAKTGEEIGLGSISMIRRKHRGRGKPDDAIRGEINVPVDNRGDDSGETSILTPDKPLTLAEMYDLFKIDPKEWVPVTFTANQWQGFYKSSKTWSAAGRGSPGTMKAGHTKVALWQTRATWKRRMGETLELQLLDFLRANVRPLPKPKLSAGKAPLKGHMVAWGLWDAHLGMYAWAPEVGASMDLNIAVNRVCNSIDDMVEKLQRWPSPIEEIVMPLGNDFLHYDQSKQRTTNGEHHLDADGRYAKVYVAGLKCLIYMVERAVQLCPKVKVLYVPGNHDLVSSYTLCVALSQRFLHDPRVEFDLRPNPRKRVVFGGTLLAFDHGQEAKAGQLAQIISAENADVWSKLSYREVQVGHVHQRRFEHFETLTPTNGVTVRVNPCLSNVDVWHHNKGLIGEPMKSVEAWFYSRIGYEGSLVAWARDDENAKTDKIPLSR